MLQASTLSHDVFAMQRARTASCGTLRVTTEEDDLHDQLSQPVGVHVPASYVLWPWST